LTPLAAKSSEAVPCSDAGTIFVMTSEPKP
jgi:hypothetical protein